MREQYEEASALYKQEILHLKNALQQAQNHAQTVKENIRIILQTNKEKFSAQLKTAMDKGWEAWAAQTAELHSYRTNWANQKKEGRGLYKLNNETVATMREDLAKDYRELAEQHSEELAQLLEDFGEGQEQLLDRLMEMQATTRRCRGRAGNRGDNRIPADHHAGTHRGGDKPGTSTTSHKLTAGRTKHNSHY